MTAVRQPTDSNTVSYIHILLDGLYNYDLTAMVRLPFDGISTALYDHSTT